MRTVDTREAQANFSKLIEAVKQGEQIVIAIAGSPAAMLVPPKSRKPVRKFGAMKGNIHVDPDFDAPLPDDLEAAFGAR
ncbi:type II toxin-antitoxin system Phd/YefM family antitoxin [Massilia endophytica]|uniref:type II toxin-antitoxin system Phd/YefM family antitoxin n=1 Tax=Massilia endophytica TaxID=2899220 RepID=UPI001E43E74B|nr:type II toxin-antitoxin system prevent-host-death family antitoxin [Massilia endophytica]UGQ49132.1 type II toxin-antitoxin system prevent-host-death family antitoxin [Massilia endophytica]